MSSLFKLVSPYEPKGDQPRAIEALGKGLKKGLDEQILLGVTGSGKTFTMAQIIAQSSRPAMILAHNKTLAAQLYDEMKSFFPQHSVEYFVSYYDYYQPEAYVPASDTYIEKDASINEYIEQMRLSTTKSLMSAQDVIIVATVSAIYGLGDPSAYGKMAIDLAVGQEIFQRDLLIRLTACQYNRNDMVLERGHFRVRGDVIDIFPAESAKFALRVELFDEVVEKLSWFDPLSGQLEKDIKKVSVYPKSHFVTPKERILKVIEEIKAELKDRLKELESMDKLVEAQRLKQRTLYDIEMMLELGYCSGIENYSRFLTGKQKGEPPPTLIDYLPKESILFIDESHMSVPQIGAMYKGDRSRKENLVEYGFRLPSALDNRPLRFEEFVERRPQTIYVSATPGKYEYAQTQTIVEQVVRPTGLLDPQIDIRSALLQVDDVLGEIKNRVKQKQRILITTLTKKMAEQLTDYLNEQGVKVRYMHSDIATVERIEIIRDLRLGAFDVLVGINLLREGLDLPEVGLVAIFDADKEGFLRSESALIQTIGRAARNVDGLVIMYAEKITGSMQRAIDETNRRREKQQAYNEKHGITPQSIVRAVRDNLVKMGDKQSQETSSVVPQAMAIEDIDQQLKQLKKQMQHHAKALEFEEAARVRDQILELSRALKQ